ncbi:MAG: hypothetical protein L6V82_06710 [Clostridiales bacterium]|nr:MAG: hypothetical protein L6V82_06710 [Clostridiales bacterium]
MKSISDFIGMKFVIKYRNTEKQDEEVPLWDENSYRFYDLSYSGFDVKTAGEKNITFTCIATDVVLPYKVTEDDFVYDFEFVKYDKEKKEYVSVKKEDSVRRNYLVGEKFDAQNTKIRYIYKSLKKAEPVDISESQISGFDTTTASDKKMFILSLLTGVETFNYSVFEETAVKGVTLNNKDFAAHARIQRRMDGKNERRMEVVRRVYRRHKTVPRSGRRQQAIRTRDGRGRRYYFVLRHPRRTRPEPQKGIHERSF